LIHETAIVSKEAKLGKNINIGPFAIIDGRVEIGDDVEIGPRAHIIEGSVIGNNNYIGEGTIISDKPQDTKYKNEKSFTKIGNNNVIREYVTIHRATHEGEATVIGNDCFIMLMAHIAHDCRLGNGVTMVNNAGLAGHIDVGDFAFISGHALAHQHTRIGAHAMVGGATRVVKDVMPFVMVADDPLRNFGLNKVGLKRRGFTPEKLAILDKMYKIFFRDKLVLEEALKQIETEVEQIDEVKQFVEFARTSKRGLTR
jgi:UDP-N-acetylglucosamine acyltransferase